MAQAEPLTIRVVADADRFDPAAAGVGVTGVPVWSTDDGPVVVAGVPALAGGSGDLDPELARRFGFKGKRAEVLTTRTDAGVVVFVGCGRRGDFGVDPLRRAAAAFVRAAGRSGGAAFVLPAELSAAVGPAAAGQAVAEGAALAAYRFVAYRSEDDGGRVTELVVVDASGEPDDAVATGVGRGSRIAAAVALARDLVNEPPSSLTPRRLAAIAEERVGSQPGVTVEVWDEDRIAAERLGGLLGVARGSAEPPRLIRATYEPEGAGGDAPPPHVVLVGKGITFDSGGLSLKTPGGMTTMKTDMGGAAAVLAAVSACGDLGITARVTAIAPVTENMPGGRAQKPGDVLTVRDGQTIEVLNTDAEGRLVLADGLVLAVELEPDAIIDLATLTGACVVALGDRISGLFGNDDDLIGAIRSAAEPAGEPVWPLPLPEEYRSHIDSEIADMKNIGKAGEAGAIAAAMLLSRFVGDVPWAHLDIAGPARSEEDKGIFAKGGTGVGVRTLLQLLADYTRP